MEKKTIFALSYEGFRTCLLSYQPTVKTMASVTGLSLRERAKSTSSLLCLLQALIGEVTTVELHNETSVRGLIKVVDGFMNVEMSNVIFTNISGVSCQFEYFYVQGKRIRFVHIPDHVDIVKAIEKQLKIYSNYRRKDTSFVSKARKHKKVDRDIKNKNACMQKKESQELGKL